MFNRKLKKRIASLEALLGVTWYGRMEWHGCYSSDVKKGGYYDAVRILAVSKEQAEALIKDATRKAQNDTAQDINSWGTKLLAYLEHAGINYSYGDIEVYPTEFMKMDNLKDLNLLEPTVKEQNDETAIN